MRFGLLLTCRKHLHDSIISLRGAAWAHETSLIQPRFITVPVPSQEIERTCICVLRGIVFASFYECDI